MHDLDMVDARILLARDSSPEASIMEIAAALGISRNTVHIRLKRLSVDLMRPSSVAVPPAAVGRPLLAFVAMSVSQQQIESIYAAILAIPEVLEAHTTTGNSDLILRVVARDTADLHRVTQRIQLTRGVQRTSTSIATTEVIPYRTSPLLHQLATGA